MLPDVPESSGRFVEGFLLVTPEEHEFIKELPPLKPKNPALSVWGVPVLQVNPDEPFKLASGKIVLNVEGKIYVLPKFKDLFSGDSSLVASEGV